MKALLLTIAAAGSMLVAAQANAVDAKAAEALAQKSGCLACHSVEKKVIGPAYKDVAAKYKGDKGAEARLVAKVKAGGVAFGALWLCQQWVHKLKRLILLLWFSGYCHYKILSIELVS